MSLDKACNILMGCHIEKGTPSPSEINDAIMVLLKEVQLLKKEIEEINK